MLIDGLNSLATSINRTLAIEIDNFDDEEENLISMKFLAYPGLTVF